MVTAVRTGAASVGVDKESIYIFANPIAGRGRGRSIAGRLEARLRADGYDVHTLLDRADRLAPGALPRSARAAIVIGGDGTLRTVADRLYLGEGSGFGVRGSGKSPAGEGKAEGEGESPSAPVEGGGGGAPPLLVVPLGTANLMGKYLGIRWDESGMERHVARAIARREVVRLDAARANGRLFLLMAGVGFDARVVHELDRMRRGPIDLTSYVLPAALAITTYSYPALQVTVDGRPVFGPEPGVAFVGNLAEYGTGFPMLPHARPDDGLLDVCALPCRSRNDLMRLFLQAAVGEHLQAEGAVYRKGRHVHITAPEPVPVQVDGDSAGHTPLDIDLLPIRLPFIVP